MRTLLYVVGIVVLLMTYSPVYGFSDKGENCSKCHTLTNEEAVKVLKEFVPNPKVIDIKDGPVRGLWEVAFDAGKKGIAYIDFSKKYVITGAVLNIADKRNLTQERHTELNKVNLADIPLDDALIMGSKDAKYRVVVFDDPD